MMGLDMYLTGEKYIFRDWKDLEKNVLEDGFRLKQKRYELGYWRKHPDLHGYIVDTFADGLDDCREIELSANHLKDIVSAIKESRLPHTEGFFFGESQNDRKQRQEAVEIFEKAIKWLLFEEEGVLRSVYYQASW